MVKFIPTVITRLLLSITLLLVSTNLLGQNTDCFGSIYTSNNGCDVSFSASIGTGGTVTSYDWRFGDGGFSSQESPSHTYAQNGTYSIELTISTSDTCSTTITETVVVTGCMECDASFNSSVNGCYASFSDNSISYQSITGWSWYFGDGNSSSEQNPSHTYTADGTYTVSLDVTASDGCTDTYSETITITSCTQDTSNCSASFSYNESGYCEVYFSDASYSSNGSITSYSWDFGDGGGSSSSSPSHSYTADGTYSVSLTVYSSDGCSDTYTEDITVSTCTPICSADYSFTAISNCSYMFTDASSSSTGSIVAWYWDFGDGSNSKASNPTHRYEADGTYEVSLTITGADNCTDSISHSVSVTTCTAVCQADFQHSSSGTTGADACQIGFSDASYSETGSIVSWYWEFGDGSTSSLQNPTHTYADDGTYSVSLTIFTSDSCTSTMSDSVLVTGCSAQCTAEFTYTPESNCEFSFSDLSISTGSISSWYWDFGDGDSSTDESPSHTYAADGTYSVSLTITTSDGCSNTASHTISVIACTPKCEANFSYRKESDCEFSFTDASVSTTASITNWHWDFDDGTSSTAQNPMHTFGEDGAYTVVLVITTSDGCVDTTKDYIFLTTCSPVCEAEFEGIATGVCEYEFTDQSTSQDGTINSWSWDFGDGNTSNVQNPTHSYTSDGTHTVSLTITTSDGCTKTRTHTYYTTSCAPACEASFSGNKEDDCDFTFTDASSASPGYITDWFWDFDDGTTSTVQNPTHAFPEDAAYTVTLVIETSDGCRDTTKDYFFLTTCSPVCEAKFEGIPIDFCQYEFNDQSTSEDGTITSWAWDFGDGTTSSLQNPTHTFTTDGDHSVSLTITTSDGCTRTRSHSFYTTSCAPDPECTADFSYFHADNCEAEFTDKSTVSDPVVSWSWDFGDGHIGSGNPVSHIFSTSGSYEVILVITTTSGCTDTSKQQVIIDQCVDECFADFSYYHADNCEAEFVEMSTVSNPVVSWEWDFGDGTVSSAQFPKHVFEQMGTYTTSLIITTSTGCTDTVKQDVIIYECPSDCEAKFSVSQDTADQATYYFTDISEEGVSSWEWDFGDGNSSNEQHPSHTYSSMGAYFVSLTISKDSCTDTYTKIVNISSILADLFLSDSVEVYPNPTSGGFNIETKFKRSVEIEINLVDINGRMAMPPIKGDSGYQFKKKIDISKLPQGVYILQMQTKEGLLYRQRIFKR